MFTRAGTSPTPRHSMLWTGCFLLCLSPEIRKNIVNREMLREQIQAEDSDASEGFD
jgi:hypothetical protein